MHGPCRDAVDYFFYPLHYIEYLGFVSLLLSQNVIRLIRVFNH